MYRNHLVLGLVPARGGSEGIPGKNIIPLAGRPLLAYTADAALASRVLDRVVLSTDDDDIAAVGAACGLEVPFRRPANLSDSVSPALPVIRHAVQMLGADGWRPEVVVLLQPTSPLRVAADIDAGVELLLDDDDVDVVVSVVEVPHQFTPGSLMEANNDGLLHPYLQDSQPLRRQDKPTLYARNGPALLVLRVSALEKVDLYEGRVRGLLMPRGRSIDIDDAYDLAIVEALLTSAGD